MVGTHSSSTHKYLIWQPLTRQLAKIIKLLKCGGAKHRRKLALTKKYGSISCPQKLEIIVSLKSVYFSKQASPIGSKQFIYVYLASRWNALSYFLTNQLESQGVLPYQFPTIPVHLFLPVMLHKLDNNSVFNLFRIRQSVCCRDVIYTNVNIQERSNFLYELLGIILGNKWNPNNLETIGL